MERALRSGRILVCQYASMLCPRCHSSRKANSTLEILGPKCMKCNPCPDGMGARASIHMCTLHCMSHGKEKVRVLPAPMAHRVVPISIPIAQGHASADAVKATAGGWSSGSSGCLPFPLSSHM